MDVETTYYLFGSIFFVLNFVLLIVLIIGAIMILRNLKKLQNMAEERLEKRSALLDTLPYLPMVVLETMRWWKRR